MVVSLDLAMLISVAVPEADGKVRMVLYLCRCSFLCLSSAVCVVSIWGGCLGECTNVFNLFLAEFLSQQWVSVVYF